MNKEVLRDWSCRCIFSISSTLETLETLETRDSYSTLILGLLKIEEKKIASFKKSTKEDPLRLKTRLSLIPEFFQSYLHETFFTPKHIFYPRPEKAKRRDKYLSAQKSCFIAGN